MKVFWTYSLKKKKKRKKDTPQNPRRDRLQVYGEASLYEAFFNISKNIMEIASIGLGEFEMRRLWYVIIPPRRQLVSIFSMSPVICALFPASAAFAMHWIRDECRPIKWSAKLPPRKISILRTHFIVPLRVYLFLHVGLSFLSAPFYM